MNRNCTGFKPCPQGRPFFRGWLLPLLAFLLIGSLSGCGNLLGLKRDLQDARTSFGQVSGVVESGACARCATIVTVLGDGEGPAVLGYRVFEQAGRFEVAVPANGRHLFAFHDLNGDFEYQTDEPGGWLDLPPEFAPGKRLENLRLSIRAPGAELRPGPSGMGNLFSLRAARGDVLDVQLGRQAHLDDARFDPDLAALGMWQPLHFIRAGYAGIYFLGPYAPQKTPVLFVHGINGSPRDFASLIASLDQEKFQPWVFYYPSGLGLRNLGDGMLGMVSELHHRYSFEALHVVAHSMGGLVARSYLAACEQDENCKYLRSFVSISSPFGGDPAAQSGVDYSPVVMPVWNGMAPGSHFLEQLFARPLPQGIPHFLLFGFHNSSRISASSGDGTIPLLSQLRPAAQRQATALHGFDEDHVGILGSPAVHAYINAVLAQSDRK